MIIKTFCIKEHTLHDLCHISDPFSFFFKGLLTSVPVLLSIRKKVSSKYRLHQAAVKPASRKRSLSRFHPDAPGQVCVCYLQVSQHHPTVNSQDPLRYLQQSSGPRIHRRQKRVLSTRLDSTRSADRAPSQSQSQTSESRLDVGSRVRASREGATLGASREEISSGFKWQEN